MLGWGSTGCITLDMGGLISTRALDERQERDESTTLNFSLASGVSNTPAARCHSGAGRAGLKLSS